MKIVVLMIYHYCFLRSGQTLLHTALRWLKESKCQEQDYRSTKYDERNTLFVLSNLQLYFVINICGFILYECIFFLILHIILS